MLVFVLVIVLIGTILYIKAARKSKNLPPGPVGWFGIRSFVEMMRADPVFPHEALKKLAKKYGDIMSIDLGVNRAVVFSKFEDMVEIFTKDEFTSRYRFQFMDDRSYQKELGILSTNGDNWQTIRKFSNKALREFGFRKSEVLANSLRNEFDQFSESFGKSVDQNHGIIDFESNFSYTVVNIISDFVLGFRSREVTDLLKRFVDTTDDTALAFSYDNINISYPAIGRLFPKLSGRHRDLALFKEHQDICKALIAESKKHYTNDYADPFNFVEAFKNEIDKESGNPNSHFTEQQLIMVLVDLFLAGAETTNHILGFSMLHLVRNPEMQEKVYAECCAQSHENPCYADADKMKYTQAFINEVFRYCNIAPIPLSRKALVDYKYKGFVIPKGTCAMYNLHCVFTDSEYWGDPENFRPERFLDPSTGKLTKTERLIMFGLGKRICIGDVLAKQTAFVYFTGMVKNFKFEKVSGQNLPTDVPRCSFTSKPRPFKALVTRRH